MGRPCWFLLPVGPGSQNHVAGLTGEKRKSDLGEKGLRSSPMLMDQEAENPYKKNPFISCIWIQKLQIQGHLDSLWHSCTGARVKPQPQERRVSLCKY